MKEKFKNHIIRNSSFYAFLFRLSIILLLFLHLFIVIVVPSASMYPTIKVGDMYLTSKIAYREEGSISREDVVVFKDPNGKLPQLIKRCMGLPGDVLQIKDSKLHINGEVYPEPFLREAYAQDSDVYYVPAKGDKVIVDDNGDCYIGEYYVGDNGFISHYCDEVNGEYVVREDCYFMLGDNCNNSLDSRFWTYHYVPKSLVVGKALFKIFHLPWIDKQNNSAT